MRLTRKAEASELDQADDQQLKDIKGELLQKFGKSQVQYRARMDLRRDDSDEILRRSRTKGILDELCIRNFDKQREINQMEELINANALKEQGAPSIYICNRESRVDPEHFNRRMAEYNDEKIETQETVNSAELNAVYLKRKIEELTRDKNIMLIRLFELQENMKGFEEKLDVEPMNVAVKLKNESKLKMSRRRLNNEKQEEKFNEQKENKQNTLKGKIKKTQAMLSEEVEKESLKRKCIEQVQRQKDEIEAQNQEELILVEKLRELDSTVNIVKAIHAAYKYSISLLRKFIVPLNQSQSRNISVQEFGGNSGDPSAQRLEKSLTSEIASGTESRQEVAPPSGGSFMKKLALQWQKTAKVNFESRNKGIHHMREILTDFNNDVDTPSRKIIDQYTGLVKDSVRKSEKYKHCQELLVSKKAQLGSLIIERDESLIKENETKNFKFATEGQFVFQETSLCSGLFMSRQKVDGEICYQTVNSFPSSEELQAYSELKETTNTMEKILLCVYFKLEHLLGRIFKFVLIINREVKLAKMELGLFLQKPIEFVKKKATNSETGEVFFYKKAS